MTVINEFNDCYLLKKPPQLNEMALKNCMKKILDKYWIEVEVYLKNECKIKCDWHETKLHPLGLELNKKTY